MSSQLKSQDIGPCNRFLSRHHLTVLPRLGANRKESPEAAHIRGRTGHSAPRQQQSTEGAPTPNSGRGAETEPEVMMYFTAMIRTLPYTAGLQTYGVRRTKQHLY